VNAICGEHRQVQHRDARALQHQRERFIALTQPPTQRQQRQRCRRYPGIAGLDWNDHAFGCVAQKERQAEEQQYHADPQHSVAAQ
jgi:hypothetical protein